MYTTEQMKNKSPEQIKSNCIANAIEQHRGQTEEMYRQIRKGEFAETNFADLFSRAEALTEILVHEQPFTISIEKAQFVTQETIHELNMVDYMSFYTFSTPGNNDNQITLPMKANWFIKGLLDFKENDRRVHFQAVYGQFILALEHGAEFSEQELDIIKDIDWISHISSAKNCKV